MARNKKPTVTQRGNRATRRILKRLRRPDEKLSLLAADWRRQRLSFCLIWGGWRVTYKRTKTTWKSKQKPVSTHKLTWPNQNTHIDRSVQSAFLGFSQHSHSVMCGDDEHIRHTSSRASANNSHNEVWTHRTFVRFKPAQYFYHLFTVPALLYLLESAIQCQTVQNTHSKVVLTLTIINALCLILCSRLYYYYYQYYWHILLFWNF